MNKNCSVKKDSTFKEELEKFKATNKNKIKVKKIFVKTSRV